MGHKNLKLSRKSLAKHKAPSMLIPAIKLMQKTKFFLFFKACLNKWDKIPDDTDILITHTPPVGYGDLCCTGVRAGCVELLNTVRLRVRPKYHIYGHIHEGYGVRYVKN